MQIKEIKKDIKRVNRHLKHHHDILSSLDIADDREKNLYAISNLSMRKMHLESLLADAERERKTRFLKFITYSISAVGIVLMFFSALLYCGDKEAEIQRNKLYNHRIEQAYNR